MLDPTDLVSIKQIALRLGVTTQAVSNHISARISKTHPFPDPVWSDGIGKNPTRLFSWDEVTAWQNSRPRSKPVVR